MRERVLHYYQVYGYIGEESDEDERIELLIMNMNFMNFFALLFEAIPEDVGIPNPCRWSVI